MMILAQNVPPAITGGWLWGFVGVAVALGAVLFCWNQLVKALDRHSGRGRQIQPSPLVVTTPEQFTKREEFTIHCAENRQELEAVHEEIKKDRADNQIHASERQATLFRELKDVREKLEKRINRMSIGVARLCGRLNVEMPDEDAEL